MEIINKNLGISTEDVYSCDDLLKLREWRVGVALTLHEISCKLTEAKAHKHRTGVYVDKVWFERTEKARRLQEILLFQIEHQIEKLNQPT